MAQKVGQYEQDVKVELPAQSSGTSDKQEETVYFSLFPTRYSSLFRLHIISAILFPLHVSGLTGPSSGGPNCTRSLWYSPPENGIVYHHYIKIVYQVGNKEK